MNVNEVRNATFTRPPTATPSNELGQEQFLELMLVQLQNQSPLDPMNSEQFLGQLAQFTTIEQLTAMNAGLDQLALGQAGIVAGQTVSMIGRSVIYDGNDTQLVDGESTLRYELGNNAQNVVISIKNEDGTTIRTIELDAERAGEHVITWDGKSDNGAHQADGTYTFEVEATNGDGDQIPVRTYSSGRVDGVTYRDGVPQLIMGNSRRSPAEIIEIGNE